MPNPYSHSAVSSAIRKFFYPFFVSFAVEPRVVQVVPDQPAAQSGPVADQILIRMIASLLKTGRQATALSMAERACQAQPLQPEYHNSRGLVLRACHRDAEALEAFDTALSLKPDYHEAFVNWQRSPGFAGARPT